MIEEPERPQIGFLHRVLCAVVVPEQPARQVECGIEMWKRSSLEAFCPARQLIPSAVVIRRVQLYATRGRTAARGVLGKPQVVPNV